MSLLTLALLHVLPIVAIYGACYEFSQMPKRSPFQFGMPELLVLPLVVSPTLLVLVFPHEFEDRIPIAYLVMIHQFTFAFVGWATAQKTGWKPAARMLIGSVVGLVALILSYVSLIVAASSLGLRR